MPQKLIKQIKEIKNAQLNAGSGKWTYRSSGNVLELLVLPQYVHNKNAFRCSVISAGQALAALRKQYSRANEELFVQTFPNIENPKVICSIRIDDSGYSKSDSAPASVIFENSFGTIDEYLLKTAGNFQLGIQDAYLSDETLKLISGHTRFDHLLLLVSKLDNPFTWLNVGYWKEAVNQYLKCHKSKKDFFLDHFSDHREEFKKYTDLKSGLHLQGIISY